MAHRTKDEAQLRMAMGVARVAMRQGLEPAEGVKLLREYFATVQALESSPPAGVCQQSEVTRTRRLSE